MIWTVSIRVCLSVWVFNDFFFLSLCVLKSVKVSSVNNGLWQGNNGRSLVTTSSFTEGLEKSWCNPSSTCSQLPHFSIAAFVLWTLAAAPRPVAISVARFNQNPISSTHWQHKASRFVRLHGYYNRQNTCSSLLSRVKLTMSAATFTLILDYSRRANSTRRCGPCGRRKTKCCDPGCGSPRR